jgi:hypothetical protein
MLRSPPPAPPPPPPPPPPQLSDIDILNGRAELDFFTSYNNSYRDTVLNDDPYYGITINSGFHDIYSLSNICRAYNGPVFLGINIQSLQSKHENLCLELDELIKNNINVDVIALQEIWDVRYPELMAIDGFKPLIYRKRRGMRGGVVGFFIKNSLNAEIIENLSPFENKIIESLTILLSYPSSSQPILLTCVYRSNGPIVNVSASQQMDRFLEKFSNLLVDLKATV